MLSTVGNYFDLAGFAPAVSFELCSAVNRLSPDDNAEITVWRGVGSGVLMMIMMIMILIMVMMMMLIMVMFLLLNDNDNDDRF